MKITSAQAAAENWVAHFASNTPELRGAYLSGSFLTAPAGGDWPASSDIDIVLVFCPGTCPPKIGKLRQGGVLLEITCIDETELHDLSHVLSTHYLAYALHAGKILYDPTGLLARLHSAVQKEYARPQWVQARCDFFYQRIQQAQPSGSLAQQVNGWAFTTGVTCFPILLAGLQNCTVRKRYLAARQLLESRGMAAFYPSLLSLLVPEPLGRARLSTHMKELEQTFTLACARPMSPHEPPFGADISPAGAPIAIGGSWELIESAHPEDAVFWMLATFARCHLVAGLEDRLPALRAFLRDLGIHEEADFVKRLHALREFLPRLQAAQREIMAKSP